MHGFKSFAEPVVIDFHEGVTCIVGPNGSGKSNISDALRWVLGEQSPKMLRGGKMEEVIFNGTASRKSRGMAEVTLVIDNSTGILPIDYNEVSITRRMYRSGESEYLINNNNCRLRDIRELIMDTGIGVDGYSIIGQGKIQSIIDGKPEQRREILEESAGVVMYKSKKAEAERKLDATQLNLDRVNDIIGEIEGRIDGLKEDSIKAKEFLELREKRKDLEINITLRNVEKYAESNEASKEDAKQIEESLVKIAADKAEIDTKLEADRVKQSELEELDIEARDKKLEKTEQLGLLTSESQVNDEKLSTFERDEARLKGEIDVLNQKLTDELAKADKHEEDKINLGRDILAANDVFTKAVEHYNETQSKSIEISNDITEKKNEILDLTAKVSGLRSESKSYAGYEESLLSRKATIEADSKEMDSSKNKLEESLKNAESEMLEVNKKLEANRKAQADLAEKKSIVEAAIRKFDKDGEDYKILASQAMSRKKTIEEMETNYEGYNGAVRFIMREKLPGIRGVVTELMQVPNGYEVAIETALGGNLQNIICDKDNDAKRAINMLKEAKAGRLTFLPVESVKQGKQTINEAIKSARGFKGIASDIISYDSKYDGVFSYLLGRTAIVDNMDTAVQLSKISGAGVRFVTLEGEIINTSGAITGGKFKNATANLLSRRNEIETLSKQIIALEEQFKASESQRSEKATELEKIIHTSTDLINEKHELDILSANLGAKINTIKESSQGAEESAAKRENELRNIESDLVNNKKLQEKADRDAAQAENDINGLKSEIELKMFELEGISNEIATANEEVTAARVSKTELENKVGAIDDLLALVLENVDNFTEEIDQKNEELEKLNESRNKLLFGSGDAEETAKKLQAEIHDLDDYIIEVSKKKSALSDEINNLTQQQSSLGNQINTLNDQKHEHEIKTAQNETRLDLAKQKLLDDFEISYAQALEFKREDFVYSTAVKESREIKNRMDMLGDVNVGAIKEYEETNTRYQFLSEQRADITQAMDELNAIISDMDKIIKKKFKENFDQVVTNFESTFKELFGGGQAELRISDENNPLEAGIEIIAQPPGKKLQNINLLSGGEKTMTAIALMFAVLKTKPTPFCILDEVEAALDDANIDRFAEYLRKFNEIQFTIITHQKVTMEHADALYGVTMPEQGISKMLSLRLGDNFEL